MQAARGGDAGGTRRRRRRHAATAQAAGHDGPVTVDVVGVTGAAGQPKLGDNQVRTLCRYGTEQAVAAGDVLFADGDQTYDLIVVLDGFVDIVKDHGRPTRRPPPPPARWSSSARWAC